MTDDTWALVNALVLLISVIGMALACWPNHKNRRRR